MASYHQAFLSQARAMLLAGYVCPCGCAAAPSIEDLARDLWAQSLVGSIPRYVPFAAPATASFAERGEKEPTVSGLCRCCGGEMKLFEYLADFLREQRAPWPECDSCNRLTVH